mmetsp:Transcript_5962/g.18377  ORF Transcript_5962/g.18377 Transcript_5962/m.18377 type:complete len:308 (+) Transcript_5962:1151-2074(+)
MLPAGCCCCGCSCCCCCCSCCCWRWKRAAGCSCRWGICASCAMSAGLSIGFGWRAAGGAAAWPRMGVLQPCAVRVSPVALLGAWLGSDVTASVPKLPGSFLGYGRVGLRLGRGGGMSTLSVPSLSRSTLLKNFCAWLRVCTAVLVPMCSCIMRHWRPYSCSASRKSACSSSLQRSRCLVMVYGLRTLGASPHAPPATISQPKLSLPVAPNMARADAGPGGRGEETSEGSALQLRPTPRTAATHVRQHCAARGLEGGLKKGSAECAALCNLPRTRRTVGGRRGRARRGAPRGGEQRQKNRRRRGAARG